MAKKPSITTLTSGFNSTTTLNNNFTALRNAFDNTLSLDGSTPNAMNADFDMNGNNILNANSIETEGLSINGVQVGSLDLTPTTSLFTTEHTGNGSTTTFSMTYNPGVESNTYVFVDGVYQNKSTYSISGTNVVFSEAPPLNSKIELNVFRALTLAETVQASNVSYTATGASALRTVQTKLDEFVSVKDFGAVGDGSTDDTVAIQAAIDAAIAGGSLRVHIPAGEYKITDTITIDQSLSLYIYGDGERTTELRFYNAVTDKVFFDATAASSNTHFEDLHFVDNTAGTSTCFRAQDDLPDTDGFSHYKDSFERCRVSSFKTGILITTSNPASGATHAFCSEPLFLHSRFKNNRTAFRVQNLQAVDITLVATDIENDDAGESYTFIRDDVGATFNIYGGSFVGKGVFYDCYQAVGSTSLWQAGKLSVTDARFELRSPHNGTVLKPVASSFGTNGTINLDRCLFLNFTQTLTLVNFGGKTAITTRDCKVTSGTLKVIQSPTTGITSSFVSADGYYNSFGSVDISGCYGVVYEKATSSPYGSYDERYTAPTVVKNSMSDPSGSYTIDANGFMTFKSNDFFQRGAGLGPAETKRLVYNLDRPLSSFGSVKFILPNMATPIRFFLFKHPNYRTTNVQYKLYAVKDVANWVLPGTFAVATDAIEIAATGSTLNTAGYLEFPIALTSSYYDATRYFQSGLGLWTEGRMFFEIQSGATSGFVGVEYM